MPKKWPQLVLLKVFISGTKSICQEELQREEEILFLFLGETLAERNGAATEVVAVDRKVLNKMCT